MTDQPRNRDQGVFTGPTQWAPRSRTAAGFELQPEPNIHHLSGLEARDVMYQFGSLPEDWERGAKQSDNPEYLNALVWAGYTEALNNRHLHPQTIRLIAEHGNEELRTQLADAEPLRYEAALLLCEDESETVRTAVAANESAPPDALMRLGRDGAGKVRLALASNPSTQSALLTRLAAEDWADMQVAIARNPRTPPGTTMQLAHSDYPEVRTAVATNPAAPRDAVIEVIQWCTFDDTRTLVAIAETNGHRRKIREALLGVTASLHVQEILDRWR